MSNFQEICVVRTDGELPLAKYRSTKTGMTVCVSEFDGPLISGYLCIATEAQDDDGLPHTLEHLIFMGSEDYPYKGVLDQLANRCLASGTNAWTDTDHTCYTMTTAGSKGFLNLLPIYLDHILYPLLTEAAFITEVHHVNGEGDNAGVVYCEMQARENTGESLCMLNLLRTLYPAPCGYRYETGGLMRNLRESTNNQKVRAYHKNFYRPENLCVIVAGSVSPTEVLKALEPFEKKILSKGPRKPFSRPWQKPVPAINGSLETVVLYPCDENDHGLVYLAFRGPPLKAGEDIAALLVMQDYLTDTSVSPLQKLFVETDDPFCSMVKASFIENKESCFYFGFENVARLKLRMIKTALMKAVTDIVNGTVTLDMERMAVVIQRRRLRILNQVESSPHESVANSVIMDFLYGDTIEDLRNRVNQIPVFMGLLKRDKQFWLQLLKKYIVDNKAICVIGEPSPEMLKELTEAQNLRVQRQREILGEEGLAKRAEALEKAIESNEREPPKEMILAVQVPPISTISFHTLQRACNAQSEKGIMSFGLHGIPFRFQLDHIKTNFVTMTVILNTSGISQDLRMYVPLFLELLHESPVVTKAGRMNHNDVINKLEADTIHIATGLGLENSTRFFAGSHAQCACLRLLVDQEKYFCGVQWVHDLLTGIEFEPDRIQVVANKMVKDVVKKKRSGIKITGTLIRTIAYRPESNQAAGSMLRQQTFLYDLLRQLKVDNTKVVKKLVEVKDFLTRPENVTVHLAANIEKLSLIGDLRLPWTACLSQQPKLASPVKSSPQVPCHSLLLRGNTPGLPRDVITSVGSVESAFLTQCTPSLNSYTSPDFPPLLVLIQYLVQLEGPMWRQIRGQGLSYNYDLHIRPCDGLLYFVLTKSTLVSAAYREAMQIVQRHVAGEEEWDEELVEASRSSLMFEIIEKEKYVNEVALQSMLAYHRGIDMSYTRTLLEKVAAVKLADMVRVGKQYLSSLFNPATSKLVICCHPSKVNDIVAAFKEFQRNLTIVTSLDDSTFAKY
uniref:Putative zn-dependent peptidase n=1 Tax=Amblyomma aureolatum TaxID=187763 RepID=A0A1E1XGZ8_9ACAR